MQDDISEHGDIYKLMEKLDLLGKQPVNKAPLPEWTCSACGVVVAELDTTKPLVQPENWLHNYRAVLVSENGEYTLSPVVTADEDGPDLQVAQRKARISSVENPQGYIIHARCWDLIHLVLRRICINKPMILPEDRLKSFSLALGNKSMDQSFFDVPNTLAWGNGLWRCYLQRQGDPFQRGFPVGEWKDTFLISNPFSIPEVQQAINKSVWNLKSGNSRVPKARKIIPQLDLTLPLELTCRIFDFLPDFYWRGRLREVFFEIDELPMEIDWQELWLALEPLKETSKGVLNRRRILRISREICQEFIDVLDGPIARDDDTYSSRCITSDQAEGCRNWIAVESSTYAREAKAEKRPLSKRQRLWM